MNKTKIRVSFGDCDPGGIMFYANLFKYAHIAYENFLNSITSDKNYFLSDEFVIPILKAEAKFKEPIRFNDEIKITIGLRTVRDSSFELEYRFENEEKQILALASTVHVFVDKKSFHKILIPETLKVKLYDFMM